MDRFGTVAAYWPIAGTLENYGYFYLYISRFSVMEYFRVPNISGTNTILYSAASLNFHPTLFFMSQTVLSSHILILKLLIYADWQVFSSPWNFSTEATNSWATMI